MTCRSAHPFRAAPPGRSFPDRFRLVSGAHARRAVRPLLSKPFPACARRSGTPRRQAAPSRTVSGLCPALRPAAPSGRSFPNRFRLVPGAHARRAVWPLLPGPFPACAWRSRTPRRLAAPSRTVSGLCPALRPAAPSGRSFPNRFRLAPGAHARRAVRPRAAPLRPSRRHTPLTPGPAPARTPPAKRASGGRPGSAAFPRPKCP